MLKYFVINLLPPQYKEELRREENWRIILTLGVLLLLSLFCLALIFLSMDIYISSQVASQRVFSQQKEKEFKVSEIQEIEENIKTANQKLLKLDSFYQKQIDTTLLIKKISETLPSDVFLTALFFSASDKEEQGEFLVSLSGFAPRRDALFEFKENLHAEESFKGIFIPLSNWVKADNINFTLTLTVQ